MLSNLYIENLAVIEKSTIAFSEGLNIFTGETGAGKSILIDAINAIIGGRIKKDIIRTGAEKALIIGHFVHLPHSVYELAKQYGWNIENDELIITREFLKDGKSSTKLDKFPITLTALKELGSVLVNIHGQHDNQILLSKDKHIDILDDLADIEDYINRFRKHFINLSKIKFEINKIHEEQETKNEKIDILNNKINEIETADLEKGEDFELEKESQLIKNSTIIVQSLNEANKFLNGNENEMGVLDKISQAINNLDKATKHFEEIEEPTEKLRNNMYEIENIAHDIEKTISKFDFNTSKLDAIELRLDEIYKLKRKYGNTIEEILEQHKILKEEIEKIEMYDVRLNDLIISLNKENAVTDELALHITKKRKKTAEKFEQDVKTELEFLNMKGVNFEVRFTPIKRSNKGDEEIEFLLSANIGEQLKSLSKIASGGELSRIMLSIKNVLAEKDKIPTLIFDEVDQGVSGSAAQKIGLKLHQASINRQVFAVTHLPQIASLADEHFKICKIQKNGRTYTQIDSIKGDDKIDEVARIISTGEITDLIRKTAKEMIEKGQK